ncbi:sensor histidine kinase [Paludisphaera rhizosphaerae]|uniref:sensor histidine kinase n=1 Tax=Paludisphaera rhizosphaerae TaxID=2711216 RepID=UPI0013EAB4B1|nr:ATP-binding protein [Paludisphaera rhizosphaerae]
MRSRSLRWRLQAWHALILLVVVAGFGTSFYLLARRAKFDEIDAELLSGARVLEGVLRTGALRGGPLGGLRLPASLTARYAEPGREPYFVIRRFDGSILLADPPDVDAPPDETMRPHHEWRARQRGMLHELSLRGPERSRILVGRSIDRELAGLRLLGLRLALTGLAVFAAGLVGGWWLSSRAVRPIGAMSATLDRITARRLSERIDSAGVDAELEGLATILNEMLGRLETSFEQQAQFTADASHELRTPLSVILTHVELALSRPRETAEYREALAACGRAAGRMKRVVDDLLTLARADAGQLELKRERVDLAAVVEEAVELLDALAERRDVTVETAIEPVEVMGDADGLARVASNLLANAILYNRPGGRVLVTTTREGDEAVLAVIDTGVGISESDLASLFRRFHRADPARSGETGGSGLGLAICRGLVEAHGGQIAVESRLSVGTTVAVRLPADEPAGSAGAKRPSPLAGEGGRRPDEGGSVLL